MIEMPLVLAAKLGSIAVHAEEMLSTKGHEYDKFVLTSLLQDEEVKAWITKMGVLLPQQR